MIFLRCQTPELAAEITVQLIRRIAPDAAFFSDILVIPQAMGIEVEMKPNWSVFTQPIRTIQDVEK
jgi:uroporphyrinogen decarboxylase